MKRFLLLVLLLAMFAAAQLPRYTLPAAPSFGNNVSVHDPSIFKDDDGRYYTFGSHFAVSRSLNLMSWTQVASDNSASTLYGSSPGWRTVLADAFTHVGNGSDGNPPGSTWAPDVIKLNGKYYMYYSLSTWGSNRSYIGRVEANSVIGPYSNSVEVVKTPVPGANTNVPNAIDPALFFDKEGKLWMTYGSFFGGMYIFELETSGANIGLPKAGQGAYGTRIWRGGSGPEGPYIFYNPNTNYYYLMVTSGSLSTDYNMRVARSVNPNGPYTDVANRNVVTANNNNVGNKLAGNYRFEGATRGYAALGHNSVLVENGKYFVIYHTRYQVGTSNDVSGNHNQYVNQLFFNSDGWPVMAPNRYAGETAGRVEASDFNGDYDVVIHTAVGDNVAFVNSTLYTFGVDGSVMQGNTNRGSWARLNGDYYFTVTINNVAYNGVAVPQYNNDRGYAELSFTGVSPAGVSIWANKKPGTWIAPSSSSVAPSSSSVVPSSSSRPPSSSSVAAVTVTCTVPTPLTAGASSYTLSTLRGYVTCSNGQNATGSVVISGRSGDTRDLFTGTGTNGSATRTVTTTAGNYSNVTVSGVTCGAGNANLSGSCNNVTVNAAPSSSSVTPSSSSVVQSSSSEGSTLILNPQLSTLNSTPTLYYDLKGIPLGTTKPTTPGLYIEKMGKNLKKIVVK